MPMPSRFDETYFPPYKYEEYPKWVKTKDGKDVVVNNVREDSEVTGRVFVDVNKPVHVADYRPQEEVMSTDSHSPAPIEHSPVGTLTPGMTEEETKQDLKAQLESLGIEVKRQWGVTKMRQVLHEGLQA